MVPRTRAFRNPGVAEHRDIQHINVRAQPVVRASNTRPGLFRPRNRAIWYNARKEYRRDRIPRKEDNMEYRVLPHGGEKVSAIGTQPEEFAAMITDRLQLELRNN